MVFLQIALRSLKEGELERGDFSASEGTAQLGLSFRQKDYQVLLTTHGVAEGQEMNLPHIYASVFWEHISIGFRKAG